MGTIEETTTSARAGIYRRASRPGAKPVEPSHWWFAPPVAPTPTSVPTLSPPVAPTPTSGPPLSPPVAPTPTSGPPLSPPLSPPVSVPLPPPAPAPAPTPVALDSTAFAAVSERPTRPAALIAAGVFVLGLLAAATTLLFVGGDDGTQVGAGAETSAVETSAATTAVTTAAAPVDPAPASAPTTTTPAPATTAAAPVETTAAAVPSTGAAVTPSSAAPAPSAAGLPGPLPDGSAPPVLVVYNGASVLIDGAVPTQEAADLLKALAVANAKGPAVVTSRVTIDPAVPANVGIRVIELESLRFPSGSAEIVAEHGAEFDRVAGVMNSLPNVTALVIAHADQLGPEDVNLRLSQERAEAVVAYLVGQGISIDRLSARGVGETDLLAEDIGEETLALNRRTEIVFYGVLVPTP